MIEASDVSVELRPADLGESIGFSTDADIAILLSHFLRQLNSQRKMLWPLRSV